MTTESVPLRNVNSYPNSKEHFYLKLLERGADEVMTPARIAFLLGIRVRTVMHALDAGKLTLVPAINCDQLAESLFFDPGLSPLLREAPLPLPQITLEQLDYINTVAYNKVQEYGHLHIDAWQLAKAITTALTRNAGTDWRASVHLIANRIMTQINLGK